MQLPDVKTADVSGKRVFLRTDLDVPLCGPENKLQVRDDTRLSVGLPTLQYLLDQGAQVIVAGHLKRPEGVDPTMSLLPVAEWFEQKLKTQNSKLKIEETEMGGFTGWKLSDQLVVLENLRFFPGEKKNDLEFAQQLASLSDIYVNDAFATCHRKQASINAIATLLPHYAGFHLQKEITILSQVMLEPKRPLVVLIGGAKLETKLPLVEKMHHVADYVLVGGKIAHESRELFKVQHEKIAERKSILQLAELNEDESDITPKSVENFIQIINTAQAIIWNGPVGITEPFADQKFDHNSEQGTKLLAEAIASSTAYTVVGGGDTLSFLKKHDMLNKYSFYSTGGGAMLAFLSGEQLPGLEALTRE